MLNNFTLRIKDPEMRRRFTTKRVFGHERIFWPVATLFVFQTINIMYLYFVYDKVETLVDLR